MGEASRRLGEIEERRGWWKGDLQMGKTQWLGTRTFGNRFFSLDVEFGRA